jgi:hypothetical protein
MKVWLLDAEITLVPIVTALKDEALIKTELLPEDKGVDPM